MNFSNWLQPIPVDWPGEKISSLPMCQTCHALNLDFAGNRSNVFAINGALMHGFNPKEPLHVTGTSDGGHQTSVSGNSKNCKECHATSNIGVVSSNDNCNNGQQQWQRLLNSSTMESSKVRSGRAKKCKTFQYLQQQQSAPSMVCAPAFLSRRQRHAIETRLRRLNESVAQAIARRENNAAMARIRRLTESNVEKLIRRRKAAAKQRLLRQRESINQKVLRRQKNAERNRLRRLNESPVERIVRRQKNAARQKERRQNETVEERTVRLEKQAIREKMRRQLQLDAKFKALFRTTANNNDDSCPI